MKIKFKINRKKIIIFSIVVLVILGLGIYSHANAQKGKIKGVTTAKVIKKNLTANSFRYRKY